MTALPSRARAVVIGGGITGTSVAYHLAQAGWRDKVNTHRNPATLAGQRQRLRARTDPRDGDGLHPLRPTQRVALDARLS